jgi:hypothetical protein
MHMLEENHVVVYMRYSNLIDQVHGGTIHCVKACCPHTIYSPNHPQMLIHIDIMPNHIKPHKKDHHSLVL